MSRNVSNAVSITMKVEWISVPKDTYTKLSKMPQKNFILLEILQAKQKLGTGEVQKQMDSMQKKVTELSKWIKTQDQKLSAIYGRIIDNISYDKDRQSNISDFYANSVGIMSYRNKKWICGGIANIFGIMAFYAGETNIKHEDGTSINGADHARIMVGGSYYDPTFDIGLREDSVTIPWQYYYFKLPQNVMYLDRSISGKPIISNADKRKKAEALLKIYKTRYPVIAYLLSTTLEK